MALALDSTLRLAMDLRTLGPDLEAWRGPGNTRTTSSLLHHGDLMKISKGKAQCRTFFLFDGVMVYCKREKGALRIKGQLAMADVIIKVLEDGAMKYNGQPLTNCWRLHNQKKDKWIVLYTATPDQKAKWLRALECEINVRASAKMLAPEGITRLVVLLTRSNTHGFGFDLQELQQPDSASSQSSAGSSASAGALAGAIVVAINEPVLCPDLKVGDVLRRVCGVGVSHMSVADIVGLLYAITPGNTAEIEVERS